MQRLKLLPAGSLVVAPLLQACLARLQERLLAGCLDCLFDMAAAGLGAQLKADPQQLRNGECEQQSPNLPPTRQPPQAAVSALQEQLLAREHRMESQRTRKKAAAAAQRAATAAGGGGCCSTVLRAASRWEAVSVGVVCMWELMVWLRPVFPGSSRLRKVGAIQLCWRAAGHWHLRLSLKGGVHGGAQASCQLSV